MNVNLIQNSTEVHREEELAFLAHLVCRNYNVPLTFLKFEPNWNFIRKLWLSFVEWSHELGQFFLSLGEFKDHKHDYDWSVFVGELWELAILPDSPVKLRERDEKVCVMSHLDCVLRVFCKLDICSLRTIEWQATSTVLIPATFITDSIPVITEINHCEKVVKNISEVLIINQKCTILFVVYVKDFFFL